jgi:hypothetical protein
MDNQNGPENARLMQSSIKRKTLRFVTLKSRDTAALTEEQSLKPSMETLARNGLSKIHIATTKQMKTTQISVWATTTIAETQTTSQVSGVIPPKEM